MEHQRYIGGGHVWFDVSRHPYRGGRRKRWEKAPSVRGCRQRGPIVEAGCRSESASTRSSACRTQSTTTEIGTRYDSSLPPPLSGPANRSRVSPRSARRVVQIEALLQVAIEILQSGAQPSHIVGRQVCDRCVLVFSKWHVHLEERASCESK